MEKKSRDQPPLLRKHWLNLSDDAPQPLLANWLRHDIDRAAKYLLQALRESFQPAEIGEVTSDLSGLNRTTISTSELSVASPRAEDPEITFSNTRGF